MGPGLRRDDGLWGRHLLGPSKAAWRRGDDGGAGGTDLAYFERALGDAVAAEAEGAVDADEAAGIAQRPRREWPADRPIPGDPHDQQHRVVAQAREAIGRGR